MSERFAQYIDQMIQASGMASGCVETLERLQQFLEPMLFLSGLELASTFEHFYRCDHTSAVLRRASHVSNTHSLALCAGTTWATGCWLRGTCGWSTPWRSRLAVASRAASRSRC